MSGYGAGMTSKKLSLAAAAAAAVIALSGAPIASSVSVQPFGSREILTDGMMSTAYTVTNLRPSTDMIPWPVNGRLYEAMVTVAADRGTITPMIPWFNARAASGQTYRVLNAVATPQGLRPDVLMQGQSNTGKIYFDVVGDNPNSVVLNNGAEDLLIWVGNPAVAPPEAPPAPESTMAPAMTPVAPVPPPMIPGY